jgi:hypothetical protein
MANEILIIIKARNETTGAFEGLNREASLAGDRAGETITDRIVEKVKVIKDDPVLKESGKPIGDTLGETISKRVTEKVKVSIDESFSRDVNGRLRDKFGRFVSESTKHEKVKVDVDVDEKTFGAKLHSFFDRFKAKIGIDEGGFKGALSRILSGAGSEIGESVRTGFTSVFSGDLISTTLKAAGIGGILVSLFAQVGPLLGSTLGLALGGGTIAAGIVSSLKDPTVSAAVDSLKKRISGAFSGFGDLFRGPTLNFLFRLPEVFKPLSGMIAQIKHDLAPVAENLSNGVIGFLQSVLPSIGRGIEKSIPILDTLADNLPGIGDAIARLFDNLSSHPKETAQFFNQLLDGIKLLLRFLGVLVTVSFGAYKTIRDILTSLVLYGTKAGILLLEAFVGAFGWIPGIRSKLDAAKSKMVDFANGVVRELNKVPDSKTFTLYIRTVGQNTGATLQNIGRILGRAAGGIMGSASGATPSGLTWVGEHGPELLSAPAGSRVYSNPDSMRMAGGNGGGGGMFQVNLNLDGHTIASVIVDPVRRMVSNRFGGSVQAALGKG